jgi:putative ABC transport system permease protein
VTRAAVAPERTRGAVWPRVFALAWRESRTARRRLLLYMSSISLGVAALVAIDSFSENVIESVHEQSRALLGADVMAVRNAPRTPAIDSLRDSLRAVGIPSSVSTNFVSMALVPRTGGTRLVQVHAVSDDYPFYGKITTDPAPAWGSLQSGHNIAVDPALLVSLDARIGDTLTLGNAKFVITGSLLNVPGDIGISAAIGPRVYIPERFVDETGLLTFGSRADYQTLFKLPDNIGRPFFIARFQKRLLAGANGNMQAAGYNESRLASAVDQLHDYLAIVGLIALLLGGIGVASGVHAFAMRKIDPVAILRCLGATSWQVLAIYALQASVMGLIGALIGVVLGLGIQFLMPLALKDFLPVDVAVHLAPSAILLGLGIGVWVALLFSMRPLVALRRVSPLQALRRSPDADALRRARWDPLRITLSFAIAVSVLELGLSRSNTIQRGIGFTVAIGAAIAVLWLSAGALSWMARRLLRPAWPFPIRQGIASLYRPGNQTKAVVLALGFGVFLMGTLYQAQHNILHSLDNRLGEARERGVLRCAGRAEADDRLDHPCRHLRDDRRDADRQHAHRLHQRPSGQRDHRRGGAQSRAAAAGAPGRTGEPRRSGARATRGRGRCAANSARRSATR